MRYDRLIYRSRVTKNFDAGEGLSQIVAKSAKKNHGLGITGALILWDEIFVQVLEGPPGHVDQLMKRLARDPRHYDLRVLGRWPTSHRLFAGWPMASASPQLTTLPTRRLLHADSDGLKLVGEMIGLVDAPPFWV